VGNLLAGDKPVCRDYSRHTSGGGSPRSYIGAGGKFRKIFSGMGHWSRVGFVQHTHNGLWQVNGYKEVGGEKIIFAALVNNTQIAVSLRIFIQEYPINFMQFQ
jgi:hypothetical protein